MAVCKYAVRVINLVDGTVVWFDHWIFGNRLMPCFVSSVPSGVPFRLANDVAQQLRRFYPLVMVVGVYD